jgi:hypothetical protein
MSYLGKSKEADKTIKNQQIVSKNGDNQNNTNEDKNAVSENKTSKASENKKTTVKPSAKAFNGKAVLTINSYENDGNSLTVKGIIQNSYNKEFSISLYDIYVMGDNGTKFSLDIHALLAKGINNYKLVPGEKKEVEFIFKDYKESSQLVLNISKIFCYGDFSEESFTVKIK